MSGQSQSRSFALPEWVAFSLFLLVTLFTAAHHESWADEAQAWLLARDLPLHQLLLHQMVYEGSPGLWHLLLWPFIHLGFPYRHYSWISIEFCACGVALLLFASPLPRFLRLLLPFGFYLIYEYSVIARSYCLAPPLLFACAYWYPKRLERPWPYSALLILLANTSAFGFIFAGWLALFLLRDLRVAWNNLSEATRRSHTRALATLGFSAALVVWQLWPVKGQYRPASFDIIYDVPLDYHLGLTQRWAPKIHDFFRLFFQNMQVFGSGATAGNGWMTIAVLGIFGAWAFERRIFWLWVLPTLTVFLFATLVHFAYWHEGLLTLWWITCYWIGLTRMGKARLQNVAAVAVGIVAAIHVYWGLCSCRYDIEKPFSAAPEVAAYLRSSGLDKRKLFLFGFPAVAVLPYFSHNLFLNHNGGDPDRSFIHWTLSNESYLEYVPDHKFKKTLLEARPDAVVIGLDSNAYTPDQLDKFPDYSLLKYFQASHAWKSEANFSDHIAIYVRDDLLAFYRARSFGFK